MHIVVGIDCGATHLRLGLVDQKGRLLANTKVHSPLKFHADKFGSEVFNLTKQLLQAEGFLFSDIVGVGLGTPGPLDLEAGVIFPSPNIRNTHPIEIKKQLEGYFKCDIFFDRDTLVALKGEIWQGAAVHEHDVFMLTLGSGVGGAMLLNGLIYEGISGNAGEIGHMYIEGHAIKETASIPTCGLGHHGCFEAYVHSAHSLEELGGYLGMALANIAAIFNPKKVIIGGGMVKQGNFLPEAVKTMKKLGLKPEVDQIWVEYAKLGDLCGVYGAAKLALDKLHTR